MGKQDSTEALTLRRPTTSDPQAWKAYWEEKGYPWRAEPEIDEERQKFLAERRTITPNIEQGIYPFKDIKLNRADIEWLLATHENGRGPVDWNDVQQRTREGLDLRGADLRKLDLHDLPLARTKSGLKWLMTTSEWLGTTADQLEMATIHLEGANLKKAHLEGAQLINAHLEEAYLVGAYLNEADLSAAHLRTAYLVAAYLEDANLRAAFLVEANLRNANLHRANLTGAYFDPVTELENAILGEKNLGFASLADITWGGTDLAAIDWSPINMLGDEYEARQSKDRMGNQKDRKTRSKEYEQAVRANRQLAVVLRDQGLNEKADRFAYRAQLLQRKVLWRQRKFGRWLFSMLLALLSGYGYRIWRILAAYVVVVSLFALVYFVLGLHYPPHLQLGQAFLESITAFHGRVFLEQFSANTPQIWLTALEAIAGLIIEGVFIAMLIQRFFGK